MYHGLTEYNVTMSASPHHTQLHTGHIFISLNWRSFVTLPKNNNMRNVLRRIVRDSRRIEGG